MLQIFLYSSFPSAEGTAVASGDLTKRNFNRAKVTVQQDFHLIDLLSHFSRERFVDLLTNHRYIVL